MIGQVYLMSMDNTGGRDKSRVFEWENGWTKTAKHLPLSPGVQAALGVLALPTQEECDMLQPGRAKLRVSELTEIVYSGYRTPPPPRKPLAVYQVCVDCHSLAASNWHMHSSTNSCSHGSGGVISAC